MSKSDKILKLTLMALALSMGFPEASKAIPPPDFLLNILQPLIAFLGIAAAFVVSGFFWLKNKLIATFGNKLRLIIASMVAITLSGTGYYVYSSYQTEKASWQNEVADELAELKTELELPTSLKVEQDNNSRLITDSRPTTKNLDQEINVADLPSTTANSKKEVQEVQKANLDNELVSNSEPLGEANLEQPAEIDSKQVANNSWQQYLTVNNASTAEAAHNQLDYSSKITASEYLAAENLLVIDLREKRARERGQIPDSQHSRLTDFLRGEWQNYDYSQYDRVVLVCYTGARGALASEFLRNLGYLNVSFLDGGVQKAVKTAGFPFIGEANLGSPENIAHLISASEAQDLIASGVIAIDVRSEQKFSSDPLPGALHFFRDGMTTAEIEARFGELDQSQSYFAVCDSWLSCYSGKILGFEMLERGINFQGRYSK
jgi:rhodanese-related sulfurtransferase